MFIDMYLLIHQTCRDSISESVLEPTNFIGMQAFCSKTNAYTHSVHQVVFTLRLYMSLHIDWIQ